MHRIGVVAVCLLHTKLISHQRYSQSWHRVDWQICTDISDHSITLILEATDSSQTMLHIYQLTLAGWRWWATSYLILYDTQQVLWILVKIWLIRDCKFRYLSVVWGHTVLHLVETQRYRLWIRFPMVSLEFFIDIIPPATLCPWGWLIF